MLGPVFIFGLLAFICVGAIARPHIGLIGYYGFALLQPHWNWRWSLPVQFEYQKYIAIATFVGFALTAFDGNKLKGPSRTACILLAVFLGLAYLSAQFTISPSATGFYMAQLWKMVVMALLAVVVLDTPKKIIALMWVLALAQGYNAYQINLQYFQDGFSLYALRPWGYQGNNNVYSIMTVPLIAVSGALALFSEKWWQKLLAGGIMLLQLHQIMLMESRGCMLGVVVLLAVLVLLMPKSRSNVVAVAGILVMGSVLAGPPVVEEFSSAFVAAEERDSSANSRFDIWQAGASLTAEHPLLGVGPWAGQFRVPQHYPGGLNTSRKGLHNLVFEVSTGCGVPAALAYVGFFLLSGYVCLRQLWQRECADWGQCVSLAVVAGLSGYWTASMFSSGALMESSYACAAAGLASALVLQHQRAYRPVTPEATPAFHTRLEPC